jgi:hypothetical protein
MGQGPRGRPDGSVRWTLAEWIPAKPFNDGQETLHGGEDASSGREDQVAYSGKVVVGSIPGALPNTDGIPQDVVPEGSGVCDPDPVRSAVPRDCHRRRRLHACSRGR